MTDTRILLILKKGTTAPVQTLIAHIIIITSTPIYINHEQFLVTVIKNTLNKNTKKIETFSMKLDSLGNSYIVISQ